MVMIDDLKTDPIFYSDINRFSDKPCSKIAYIILFTTGSPFVLLYVKFVFNFELLFSDKDILFTVNCAFYFLREERQ